MVSARWDASPFRRDMRLHCRKRFLIAHCVLLMISSRPMNGESNPYQSSRLESGEQSRKISVELFGLVALVCLIASGLVGYPVALTLAVMCMAFLPLLVIAMLRSEDWSGRIGRILVAAGLLLTAHVSVTAILVFLLLRQPWVLDLSPYNSMIYVALNFAVPGSSISLSIAVPRACKSPTRLIWLGTAAITVGNSVALAYGYYFFAGLLQIRLSDNVWWLW